MQQGSLGVGFNVVFPGLEGLCHWRRFMMMAKDGVLGYNKEQQYLSH
jgi:hypothetical protein